MASAGDNTESIRTNNQQARRVLVKLSANLVSSPQARRVLVKLNDNLVSSPQGRNSVMATPPPQSTPKRPTFCHRINNTPPQSTPKRPTFCHRINSTNGEGTKGKNSVMATPPPQSRPKRPTFCHRINNTSGKGTKGKGFVMVSPPPQSTPKRPAFCQQSNNTSGKGTKVMTTPVSFSKREERSIHNYFLTPSSLMGHGQNKTTPMQGGETSAKRKLATAMVYGTLRKPPCTNNDDDDDKTTPCMYDDDARKASNLSLLRMKLEGLSLKDTFTSTSDETASTSDETTTTSDIIKRQVAQFIREPLKFKMMPAIMPCSPALRVKVKESKPSPFSSSKSNLKCR